MPTTRKFTGKYSWWDRDRDGRLYKLSVPKWLRCGMHFQYQITPAMEEKYIWKRNKAEKTNMLDEQREEASLSPTNYGSKHNPIVLN